TVDDDDVVIQGQGAGGRILEIEPQVDFIHDDETTALAHFLNQFLQGLFIDGCARGVARGRNQYASCTRAPMFPDVSSRQMESLRCTRWDQLRYAARGQNEILIGRIRWIG